MKDDLGARLHLLVPEFQQVLSPFYVLSVPNEPDNCSIHLAIAEIAFLFVPCFLCNNSETGLGATWSESQSGE